MSILLLSGFDWLKMYTLLNMVIWSLSSPQKGLLFFKQSKSTSWCHIYLHYISLEPRQKEKKRFGLKPSDKRYASKYGPLFFIILCLLIYLFTFLWIKIKIKIKTRREREIKAKDELVYVINTSVDGMVIYYCYYYYNYSNNKAT